MTSNRLLVAIPFLALLIGFVLYSLLWTKSAERMRAEIEAFAAREAAAGRSFQYSDIRVAGYPLMLRGKLSDVRWAGAGRAFEAAEVTIATLPYDPRRILFVPRGEKSLTIGGQAFDLETEDLRFSLEEGFAAVQVTAATLIGEDGNISVGEVIANRQAVSRGESYAVSIKGLALARSAVSVPYFDMAASRQEGRVTIAAADLAVGYQDLPAPTQVVAKGHLAQLDSGFIDGSLDLRFKNERPLLLALAELAAIDRGAAETATGFLGLLTAQGTKEMTLPLTIDEGKISLGTIPLGTIPPLGD